MKSRNEVLGIIILFKKYNTIKFGISNRKILPFFGMHIKALIRIGFVFI